ncbi:hypothetical protein AAVH_17676 [Aphelenchoides avenae]|nr:hypothetical protein AAVH_17676 [Aphelenchus avenae]
MRQCTICLVLLSLLALPTHAVDPKQVTRNKIKNLLSEFPTDAQVTKICDSLANDIYALKTFDEIASGLSKTLMGSLTGSQLVKGMSVLNSMTKDFGGMDKASATLDKVVVVFKNNLGPILTQIQNKVKTMKANGKAKAAVVNQQYTMVNQFFTKERVKTIMQRVKTKLGSQWPLVKKKENLGDIVKFGLYGL